MEEFARSDIAAEAATKGELEGVRWQRSSTGGCEILRVQIKSEQAATQLKKPQGRYITVECGSIADLDQTQAEQARCVLAVELRELAHRCCPRPKNGRLSLLVVGLGNASVTPDALGAQTVKNLSVTGHFSKIESLLFAGGEGCRITAIETGVPAQSGISSADLVRGAVLATAPDLVLAVDALAARSPELLGSTVQLCDTGVCPGSGIGERADALTAATVGVPVLGIGVPTVVNSATFATDALRLAGQSELGEELRAALRRARQLYVTPSGIDRLVGSAAIFLAQSIEKAFLGFME